MNVQNTEAWNVFIERSEQGVSAVPASLAPRLSTPPLERASRLAQERLAGTGLRQDAPPPLMGYARAGPPEQDAPHGTHAPKPGCIKARGR